MTLLNQKNKQHQEIKFNNKILNITDKDFLFHELLFLKEKIGNGIYPKSETLFKGADITVLLPDSKWINNKVHQFDNDLRIVTPYAKELSGLIYEIKEIAYKHDLIDWANKEYFFGEIGQAANNYFESNDNGIGKSDELLLIVIYVVETFIKNLRSNECLSDLN